MTTCKQPKQGLTILGTQPLHHLMQQQHIQLVDQLYQRIVQLQSNEKQFIAMLREMKAGKINLEQIKVDDNGFQIMPTPPTKPTEMPETVKHDVAKGSSNNAKSDKAAIPTS